MEPLVVLLAAMQQVEVVPVDRQYNGRPNVLLDSLDCNNNSVDTNYTVISHLLYGSTHKVAMVPMVREVEPLYIHQTPLPIHWQRNPHLQNREDSLYRQSLGVMGSVQMKVVQEDVNRYYANYNGEPEDRPLSCVSEVVPLLLPYCPLSSI